MAALGDRGVLQGNVLKMTGSEKTNEVSFSKTRDTEQDEIILQPLTYILQYPVKHIQKKLAHAFNYWLKVPADKLTQVENIVQMLHNYTILFNDMQGNSILHGDIPVAHSIYGVPRIMSAGHYAVSIVMQRVTNLDQPEALTVFQEQMLEWCRGRGTEIYWRENYTCPSVEEYQEMVKRKTRGPWMLAIPLMQLFSENEADFTELAGILGLYLEIRDDYHSLCLQEYSSDKGYCEDITEGKFSFPIIHAIKSRPDDDQVIHILRQRTCDMELKKYCVALLEKFGSFSYTRKFLEKLDTEARAEVAKLGGNPLLEDILDELLNWKQRTEGNNPEQ